jgi:hypothetical protein
VIRLRAGTSAAQRRCTLAHELVHLERGISASGALGRREELFVHREAARRLLPFPILAAAVRALGEEADARSLARELDVDGETLEVRLAMLSEAQRRELDRVAASRLVAA